MTTYQNITLEQLKQYKEPKSANEIAADLSTEEDPWTVARVQSSVCALIQKGHFVSKYQEGKVRKYLYKEYAPVTPKEKVPVHPIVTTPATNNDSLFKGISISLCIFILGLSLGYAWAYKVFG